MPAVTATPPPVEVKKKPALEWAPFVRDYCIAVAQSRGIGSFSSQSMPATVAACRNAYAAACQMIEAGPGE